MARETPQVYTTSFISGMADVYSECVGGSLKLKGGVQDGGVKKLVSLWLK